MAFTFTKVIAMEISKRTPMQRSLVGFLREVIAELFAGGVSRNTPLRTSRDILRYYIHRIEQSIICIVLSIAVALWICTIRAAASIPYTADRAA